MIRLSRNLKPFALMVACVLVLVFLQSLADLKLPSLMASIVDDGIFKGNTEFIWQTGKYMLLIALGGAVCSVISGYLSARVSAGFGKSLRSKVFSHVESFSLHEFDKIGTASLITRTTNDIMQVQMVSLLFMRMVLSAPMMAIGGVIIAVSEDARLSLILVAVLPIIAAAIAFLAAKGLPLFQAMQKKIDRLNQVLREGLTGVRVVKAFNREDHEARRFNEANRDLTATAVRIQRIMSALMPVMMLTLNLTAIAIIWIGSHRVDAGGLEIGHMMAFIQYAMQILMSLVMLSMIFVMLPRATASAERINQVLDSVPDIKDAAHTVKTGAEHGYVEFRPGPMGGHGFGRPVEKAKDFKGTLKRLVKYLQPRRFQLAVVFAFAVLSTTFSIVGPKVMGKATTKLAEGLMAKIMRAPGAHVDFTYIGNIMLTMVGLYVLSAAFNYIQQYVMAGVAQNTVYDMRRDVDAKLSRLPLEFFDSRTHGEILSRVTNDADNVSSTLQRA